MQGWLWVHKKIHETSARTMLTILQRTLPLKGGLIKRVLLNKKKDNTIQTTFLHLCVQSTHPRIHIDLTLSLNDNCLISNLPFWSFMILVVLIIKYDFFPLSHYIHKNVSFSLWYFDSIIPPPPNLSMKFKIGFRGGGGDFMTKWVGFPSHHHPRDPLTKFVFSEQTRQILCFPLPPSFF